MLVALALCRHEAIAFVPSSARYSRQVSPRRAWEDKSFDFSSSTGWEDYYRNGSEGEEEDTKVVVEWHASLPLEEIADKIPMNSKCLMIGTGLSHLPATVLERQNAAITLQDSSKTCIEQLRDRYGDTMEYAVGDATVLSSYIEEATFDIVVDKGLMDAIFCGEGWNAPIASLLEEASRVLKTGGMYLLVGYKLPPSTQEYLVKAGRMADLTWEFDVEGSSERVGISIALKT